MILLIIFTSIISYLASVGFVGNYIVTRARLRCGGRNPCTYSSHEHGGWWIAGAFWPFTLPLMGAATLAPALAYNHEHKISREERKYQKELRAAKHRQDILAIREKEIKRLEHEAGIK